MRHGNEKYASKEQYYTIFEDKKVTTATLPVSMPNFNDQNNKICGRFFKISNLTESSIEHK